MNETLRLLYDRFYTPLPMVESEQEVENCHRQLIERLDKPERKLVLRIIDAQNLMIEQRSVDSFICGFRLAWEMANELNHYEANSIRCQLKKLRRMPVLCYRMKFPGIGEALWNRSMTVSSNCFS